MINIPELNDILFFRQAEANADDYVYDIPDEVKVEQFKILMNYRFLTEAGQEVDSSQFRRSTPLNPEVIGLRKEKFDLLVLVAPLCILETPNKSECFCLHTSDFFGVVERLMYDTLNYEGYVNKALIKFQWKGAVIEKLEPIDMNRSHVINGAFSSIPLLTYLVSEIPGSPTIKSPLRVKVDINEDDELKRTLGMLMGHRWLVSEQESNIYTIRRRQSDDSIDPIGDDQPDLDLTEIDKYEQIKSVILLICLIILARILSR